MANSEQYITQIETALQKLKPLSLAELDAVSLLDRQDTKYTFNVKLLPEFLETIQHIYKVLEIDNRRIFKYDSLYFDTDDYLLYKYHHNEKVNRVKVRYRKYVESKLTFFEVKYKLFGTRTSKKRIKQDDIKTILGDTEFAKIQNVLFDKTTLKSKLWVYYSRITLVNNDFTERVTLDINLKFKNENGNEVAMENLAIAEIKQNKRSVLMPFIQMMKQKRVPPLSISKYCMGVALTEPTIKSNNFKPKFITLKKIMNA
ncbi:MAG: hypothetical protein RIQ33_2082 [Bacteroidota bacterium]|jgi:hypothetical protein